MWIFALEALVALCMLALIVWLTMGNSSRRDKDASKDSSSDAPSEDRK